MHSHRWFGEGVIVAQPRPVAAPSAQGFLVCPVPFRVCMGGCWDWMPEIYRLAYQQAREAQRRPWPERSLLASWN